MSRSYGGEVFSDHFLIGSWLFLRKPPPPLITVSSRNLKNIDDESFSTALCKLPLFLSPAESLEGRLAQYDEIALVLDIHAPIIIRRVVLRPVSVRDGGYLLQASQAREESPNFHKKTSQASFYVS